MSEKSSYITVSPWDLKAICYCNVTSLILTHADCIPETVNRTWVHILALPLNSDVNLSISKTPVTFTTWTSVSSGMDTITITLGISQKIDMRLKWHCFCYHTYTEKSDALYKCKALGQLDVPSFSELHILIFASLFIYGWIGSSMPQLQCWAGATLRCDLRASHGCSFSCCEARALWHSGFSSCAAWAELLQSTWDLPRPGIKPVSPALAGRFLTTGPPEKSINLAPFQLWNR